MTLLRLEPTRQRRATADSERVSARQARAAPLPPLPDPHAIVPSTLPPLYVIFGRGSPSAAVWSIPHRGYCSSFLINYFPKRSVFIPQAAADHVPGAPGRMRSACTWRLPELPMHAQGVQEGHPLLGGSIARPSEQPLTCGDLWRHRAHTCAPKCADGARAPSGGARRPSYRYEGLQQLCGPSGRRRASSQAAPLGGSRSNTCPASGSR